MTALSWLQTVTGKQKIYILFLLLLQVLLGGSAVLYALLLRGMVDFAADGSWDGFLRYAAGFAALTAAQIILRAIGRALDEWCRAQLENLLKQRLFSCLLRKDYASVTGVHSGEWMNRLTSDTVIVANGLTSILPSAGGMLVKMAGALAAILFLEPLFAAILIPGGAALLVLTYGFRKILKRLHKVIQEQDGLLRVLLQERLSSLMIVRAFSMEQQTETLAAQAMEAHKQARMKRLCVSNLCNTGFSIAMNGLYAFGAVFCGFGLLQGTMTYGTLAAILQLILQIQSPFASITGYLPQYYSMLASAERLMEAESFPEGNEESPYPASRTKEYYQHQFQSLGLRGASFTYRPPTDTDQERPMPVVLRNIDLQIRKGEFVAFTGPSGCGKSTVLKLLMCLYPLDDGKRFLTDTDGTEHELTAAWRSLFAYVPQGNQLMCGTIREVIAFGDPTSMANEQQLWNALDIACADFVAQLELGLDTPLGERGTGLSEGQMQRLAIARAILSDRPILLLDEATSALDQMTEQHLLENLRAMTDKTVILVTHRDAVLNTCEVCVKFSEADIIK